MRKLFTFTTLGLTILGANTAFAYKQHCREYTQTFSIAGKVQEGYGTACLQPDGSWKIVSQHEIIEKNSGLHTTQYLFNNMGHYVMPTRVVFSLGHKHHHKFKKRKHKKKHHSKKHHNKKRYQYTKHKHHHWKY